MQGVLSFKNTYFEPRYVLVVPVSKEVRIVSENTNINEGLSPKCLSVTVFRIPDKQILALFA